MKIILTKDVNLLSETTVSYPLKLIEKIVQDKYKDFYSREEFYSIEDAADNDVKPNDSIIVIRFKDGTFISFGKDWEITFEYVEKEDFKIMLKEQEEKLTEEFLTYMKNNEMSLEDAADNFCADNLVKFEDENSLELMWWPEVKEDGSIVCIIQEI